MRTGAGDLFTQNKALARLVLATGSILLVPLVATQLSEEVTWTLADFVVMGALLFGAGLAFILAARRVTKHRIAVGVAILSVLLWVWAELAVGVLTDLGS